LSWLWGREAFTPPSSLGFFVVGHLSFVVKMVFFRWFFLVCCLSLPTFGLWKFLSPRCVSGGCFRFYGFSLLMQESSLVKVSVGTSHPWRVDGGA
jgi:hypothetical protein